MRNSTDWMVEFPPGAPRVADPLMGWSGSTDTQPQVRMRFPTRDEAIAFATRNGLDYRITEPHARHIRPKSYAENFRT